MTAITQAREEPGVVGWCVPVAISMVTGMTAERACLEILADRHERGRRLLMLPGRLSAPHGGAHAAEALRVIRHAGFRGIDSWSGTRRMNVSQFLRFIGDHERNSGARSHWLVLQAMHLAAVNRAAVSRPWNEDRGTLLPGLPIAKAWRIVHGMTPAWERRQLERSD